MAIDTRELGSGNIGLGEDFDGIVANIVTSDEETTLHGLVSEVKDVRETVTEFTFPSKFSEASPRQFLENQRRLAHPIEDAQRAAWQNLAADDLGHF
jgi:hypothetical protein